MRIRDGDCLPPERSRKKHCRRNENEGKNTYCKPNKLKVNSTMRTHSLRPLIEGVPTHLAACGILSVRMPACTWPFSQFLYAFHEPRGFASSLRLRSGQNTCKCSKSILGWSRFDARTVRKLNCEIRRRRTRQMRDGS